MLGDVFLPLSMKALGYAVGGVSCATLDAFCYQWYGVRVGWMPFLYFYKEYANRNREARLWEKLRDDYAVQKVYH